MENEKKEAFIKMTDILVNCFNNFNIFDKNEVDKEDYYNACNVISDNKEIIKHLVIHKNQIIDIAWSIHLRFINEFVIIH